MTNYADSSEKEIEGNMSKKFKNVNSGWNKIKNSISKKFKTDRAWGYPRRVLLEPTATCNLRCPLCPTGVGDLGRKVGSMKFDKFKFIVDELKGKSRALELAGYGEPTVNKDIYKMLSYAAKNFQRVYMHTNCLLIDSKDKVEKLVGSGVYQIIVSIDGSTQEVYEKYRVGGNLTLALKNMKAIVEEKKRQQTESPIIEWQVVVTKFNEGQVDDMRKMSEKVGVNNFNVKSANINMLSGAAGKKSLPRSIGETFLPRNAALRRFGDKEGKQIENGCNFLYGNTFIMWNGDVTTCCHDPSGINKMGNIFEVGSFWAIWNNDKYRRLRRAVNTEITKATPLCNICPNRGVDFITE